MSINSNKSPVTPSWKLVSKPLKQKATSLLYQELHLLQILLHVSVVASVSRNLTHVKNRDTALQDDKCPILWQQGAPPQQTFIQPKDHRICTETVAAWVLLPTTNTLESHLKTLVAWTQRQPNQELRQLLQSGNDT